MLGDFPGMGHSTERRDVRMLPVVRYPYVIFYTSIAESNEVLILRIRHGRRSRFLRLISDDFPSRTGRNRGEKMRYPVVIEPLAPEDGGGFVATVPDLPGCMSDGETPEELWPTSAMPWPRGSRKRRPLVAPSRSRRVVTSRRSE